MTDPKPMTRQQRITCWILAALLAAAAVDKAVAIFLSGPTAGSIAVAFVGCASAVILVNAAWRRLPLSWELGVIPMWGASRDGR